MGETVKLRRIIALITLLALCGGLGLLCGALYRASVLGPSQTFEISDLVGTWRADYGQYDVPDPTTLGKVSGVETITLQADGTYQQAFGDVYTGPWNQWRLESGQTLHLEGGRLFIFFGTEGHGLAVADDCVGKTITLDGSELILCARSKWGEPGGVVLQHLPTGDPDSPEIVEFHRVIVPTP